MQNTIPNMPFHCSHSTIAIADKLLNAGITVILFFIAAKLVPATIFGSFNYWLAVTVLIGPFVFLGMDGRISNDLSIETGADLHKAFFPPLFLKLFLALVLSGLVVIAVTTQADGAVSVPLLAALLMIFARVLDQYDLLFYSKGLITYPFMAKVVATILIVLGGIALVFAGIDNLHLLWIIPGYPLIRNTFLVACATQLGLFGPQQGKKSLINSVRICGNWFLGNLRIMGPLLLTSISVAIFMRIDQVLLRGFVGEAELAKYGVAVRIADSLNLVGVTLIAVRMPGILRLSEDRKVFLNEIQKLSSLVVWIALLCVPITSSVGFLLESSFLPLEYNGLASIVLIYTCSSVFVYFGSLWSRWMIFEGRAMVMMYFQLAGMSVNILLNYILIPLYGCYGAAAATAISAGLGHAFLARFVKSQHEPFKVFYRSLFNGWRVLMQELTPVKRR